MVPPQAQPKLTRIRATSSTSTGFISLPPRVVRRCLIGIHIGDGHKPWCWNIGERRQSRTIGNGVGLAHEGYADEADAEFFHVLFLELNAPTLLRAHIGLTLLLFLRDWLI
jgi:hypothetical protein